jgi:hypothetical protein
LKMSLPKSINLIESNKIIINDESVKKIEKIISKQMDIFFSNVYIHYIYTNQY